MEGGTFLIESIQKEFGRFVEIALHTDGKDAKYEASSIRNRDLQRERFKTIAIPYYAILDPTGKKVLWEAGGVQTERAILEALRSVPKSFGD